MELEEIIQNDINDDEIINNNLMLKRYRKEASKYPLLTQDEETKIGKVLVQFKNNRYYSLNSDNDPAFNYKKLFNDLKNIDFDKEILKLLKNIIYNFKYNAENNILKRYTELIINKNEFLNENDLKKYFKIQNTSKNKIKNKTIISNLKKYIIYLENRQKLIESNLLLVVFHASRYSQDSVKLLDIICDGNLGLMKAVDRFDITKGFRFSTYASFWIKQSIMENIYNYNPIVISKYLSDEMIKFNEKVRELEKTTNKKYSALELSKIFKIDYEQVLAFLNYSVESASLDEKIDEETTLYDFIPSKNNDFDNLINSLATKENVSLLTDVLTEDEKEILNYRYGLNTLNNRCYTLEEIAKMRGVKYQSIQQKEKSIIYKIRRQHYNLIQTLKNEN